MSCPICAKTADPAYRPFCSRRCADVDLARWLREDYRVPIAPEEEDDSLQTPSDTDETPRSQ